MKKLLKVSLCFTLLISLFVGCSCNKAKKKNPEVTVFIAASLSNVMNEIADQYKEIQPDVTIIFNADSAGTLKKQIEEGAECDIFFSAAMKQMDELDKENYMETDSIVKLLQNKVVLIKSKNKETKVTGFNDITLASSLALAGEDVPVGAYAREIFHNMGVLDEVMKMEINECANVTAVLTAVSEESNEVGITYVTDAYSQLDQVVIISEAPKEYLDSPVIYPVGLVKNEGADDEQKQAAKDFLEYLQSDEAKEIFEKYLFSKYQK